LCTSFCRSNAHGATQQFNKREIFDVIPFRHWT
jgi:hypothetical protein